MSPQPVLAVAARRTLAVLGTASLLALAATALRPTAEGFDPSQASMSLRVFDDWDRNDRVCIGEPVVGRKCYLGVGSPFSIDVVADTPPGFPGYTLYRVVVQYSSNLTFPGQQLPEDENLWPECTKGKIVDEPGRHSLICELDQGFSSYAGPLANFDFVCTSQESSGQIDLVGGEDIVTSSYYFQPNASGNEEVYLKSVSKDGKMVADSILINCVEQTSSSPNVCAAT